MLPFPNPFISLLKGTSSHTTSHLKTFDIGTFSNLTHAAESSQVPQQNEIFERTSIQLYYKRNRKKIWDSSICFLADCTQHNTNTTITPHTHTNAWTNLIPLPSSHMSEVEHIFPTLFSQHLLSPFLHLLPLNRMVCSMPYTHRACDFYHFDTICFLSFWWYKQVCPMMYEQWNINSKDLTKWAVQLNDFEETLT